MSTTTEADTTVTRTETPTLFGLDALDAFLVFAAEFRCERDPIGAMQDRLLDMRLRVTK